MLRVIAEQTVGLTPFARQRILRHRLPRHPRSVANMSETSTKPIEIDVWSDLTCPWCWVGCQRLNKAVAAVGDKANVTVTWHAFLLDPQYHTAHPQGQPLDKFYAEKFGDRGPAIRQHLVESGTPDGATFSDWRYRPNTFPGHRLVALARRHGKSHEANQALFRKNYEEGKNISDPEVLIEAGRELALPGVEEWVRSDEGALEVLRDCDAARSQRRVTGVPGFFIRCGTGDTIFLSGAQPVETFVEAFEQAMKEGAGRDA